MTRRIFNGIFYVSLAVMLTCALFIAATLHERYTNEIIDDMRIRAGYIAVGVEAQGESILYDMDFESSRATLISPGGEVLFDSAFDKQSMDNHLEREEVRLAIAEGEGVAVRESETLLADSCYYALLLEDGSVLRLSCDMAFIWQEILRALIPVILLFLLAIAAAALVARSISKKIVRPINRIDLKHPDEGECYDELAPLVSRLRYQNMMIEKQMRKLERKQKEFTLITDNMMEGMLLIDAQARVLSVNISMRRLLGVADENISGKSAYSVGDYEGLKLIIDTVMTGGRVNRVCDINGRLYELTATPVKHGDENNGGVIIAVDVTEREDRERLRREFSSNVSHELKTPLSSIYGVSDMIMNGMVRQEDIAGFACDINSEARRLIDLINDIINISRLEDTEAPLVREELDLMDIVRVEAERFERAAKQRDIAITLTGEEARLTGVRPALQEIAHNLIENAVKYNVEGGSVFISVTAAEEIVLTVSDTGIGIAEEHKERVFERFFRVDKSHSKKIGGTGLGLSIVKHAVRLHGGRVELESELKKGTQIKVYLPKM